MSDDLPRVPVTRFRRGLREVVLGYAGRVLCRVFRYHGLTCQGRMDHWPLASVRGRWANPRRRWQLWSRYVPSDAGVADARP